MAAFNSIRLRYEPLRALGFGSISGVYAAVGTAFVNPVRAIKISNSTDSDLFISYDGVVDMDFVPSNGFVLWDYSSNKSEQGGLLEQPVGDRVYVKVVSTLPSDGGVFVTVIYASES